MTVIQQLESINNAVNAAAPGVVIGVGIVDRVESGWDVTTRADGLLVRLTFAAGATSQQQAAARAAVLSADLTPTEGQRLDGVSLQERAVAAAMLRASTQWAGLSAARKARVQQVIDDAASSVISALS